MQLLLKYFPNLNSDQIGKFEQLYPIYEEWNQKVNVISRKDFPHFYERHVLHSLAIAKFFHFPPNSKVFDIGTGGGFPGIPLAIMFPDVQFTLMDSIAKKIKVAEDVISLLSINNVNTLIGRAENQSVKCNYIVSRAVSAFPEFVKTCRNLIQTDKSATAKSAILYLKGGDFEDEIKSFKAKVHIINVKEYFEEEYFETKKIIHLPFNNS